MKSDRLVQEFAPRNVRPDDDLLLLQPADAIALVNRAADEGVPILGVRGAIVQERSVRPVVEQLADYSPRVREGHGCWQEAEAFIRERSRAGLAFQLALGDDPVEAV